MGWICAIQILRNISERQVKDVDDLDNYLGYLCVGRMHDFGKALHSQPACKKRLVWLAGISCLLLAFFPRGEGDRGRRSRRAGDCHFFCFVLFCILNYFVFCGWPIIWFLKLRV